MIEKDDVLLVVFKLFFNDVLISQTIIMKEDYKCWRRGWPYVHCIIRGNKSKEYVHYQIRDYYEDKKKTKKQQLTFDSIYCILVYVYMYLIPLGYTNEQIRTTCTHHQREMKYEYSTKKKEEKEEEEERKKKKKKERRR